MPHNFGRWDKVSLVSAVGTTGKLFFHIKLKDAFKAKDIAKFLRTLLRHVPGNLVLFWDGANQHKGPFIRKVQEDNPRLRLEFLPPYGFDYNADEGVWAHLKWNQLANFTPHDTAEQTRGLRRGMRRMQRESNLVRACFRRTKLPRRDVELLLNHADCP